MSHLACADEPNHPKSEAQRKTFDRLRARLPKALASLANSAGVLLGRAYAYDLVRPGIALYGGKPHSEGKNPFKPVVRSKAGSCRCGRPQPERRSVMALPAR